MENNTNLGERIKQLIESKGLSINKFSESVNTSNSYFNKVIKKNTSVGSDKIENILRTFTDISPEWLIMGKGEMIKDDTPVKSIVNDYKGNMPKGAKPFYKLPVSAGQQLAESFKKEKPDGFLYNIPGISDTENFLPVVGYSMDPEVKENAIIGVRVMNQWETLNTSKKYLIITKEERMIKYIEHDIENNDIIWCVSPNYPKFKVFKTDIIEIQRVTFVINPG